MRRGQRLIDVVAPMVQPTDYISAVLNADAGPGVPVDFMEVGDRGFRIGLSHVAVRDAHGTWLLLKRRAPAQSGQPR